MGDERARFSQPETELAEQPLTLSNAQVHAVALFQVHCQQLAVPQIPFQPRITRRQAQGGADHFELGFTQPARPSRAFPFAETGQPFSFEAMDPILYRPAGIAQQRSHLRTRHALRHQKHSMQPVIIARFF